MDSRTLVPGTGLLATLESVGLIVWNLIATPFIGHKRLRWGTQETEAMDPLPGDELVPDPKWTYTLGVDIAAAPQAVWPWVAQIGQRRGGFYSYQTLENMFGCKIANTTEILPEYQHPQVGDEIYLHPTAPGMRIEIVKPPHALVLFGSPADIKAEDSWGIFTWQFAVRPAPNGRSRLLTRGRSDYSPGWATRLAFGRFPVEPITFVMSRKMLL
ncbi:MAG: hypothetical protein OES46_21655, partial [Gammaproteobacteria bacterium]|nr:hypothetical protein [Gammaproteobacteria bacterium]